MHSCEALVLKTYDIGDADRYCILLTDTRGRIAVCAKGVRKPTSKFSGAVQSFQHLRADLAEHSSGMYLRSASCLFSFPSLRSDMHKFTLASHGSDLLLAFLHDTEPSEDIFALAREYFALCDDAPSQILLPTFTLCLLSALGLLPSFAEEKNFSTALHTYLCSEMSLHKRATMILPADDKQTLQQLCDRFLRNHLTFPLKSWGASVSLANSGSMPCSSV